jgi:competence protein CoiA
MENNSLHQLFAMDKKGRIRSVEEVTRGLACECSCPSCGAPVIARQGAVREWHFAHAAESDCKGGMETALHLAAKQLLLESSGLTIPEIRVQREVQLPDGRVGKGEAYRPEQWVDFQSVEAEKTVGTIRPDIVVAIGPKILFIEIAVTHFVDKEKRSTLASYDVPTIEIDLASYQGGNWTWDLLRNYVIENAQLKRWVHFLNQVNLVNEAFQAARQAALAQPVPITEPLAVKSPSSAIRTRFWIKERIVDAIERPFGIAVWSPYDPELNALIKSIVRFLGGRWQPRFKNWLIPLEAKAWLFEELAKHSSRPPERQR